MTQTLLYKLIPHGAVLLSAEDSKKTKVGQELCWVPNLRGATHQKCNFSRSFTSFPKAVPCSPGFVLAASENKKID